MQVLTFGGGVLLARVLTPAQFGLYIISSSLVGLFAQFGDFGLAPSLIQRKAELTERDLQVGFTLQQIATSAIVLLVWIFAPRLAALYPKAPPETVWLVRALAVNLYLTSWRTMSALQLERHLRYNKLAWIEVVETLTFQGLAVIMALRGYGVWSYIGATLARGVLGTVLVYFASPWPIRFIVDWPIAKTLLRYGIPFQLQSFVNTGSGWLTPLFIGPLIGPQGVGYLTWASSNGKKPLVLVDSVMRVAFPHFSRLQDDLVAAEQALIRYLQYLLLPAGLWFALLAGDGGPIVHAIYTAKWMPAVPALVIYAASLLLDVTGMVSGMALNGLGRVSFTTRLVLVRTLVNIAVSIPLAIWLGFNGIAISFLISSLVGVPWLLTGLGNDAAKRILLSLAWLCVPIMVSVIIGLSIASLPMTLFVKAIFTGVAIILTYGITAWACAPEMLRLKMLTGLTRYRRMQPSIAGASD